MNIGWGWKREIEKEWREGWRGKGQEKRERERERERGGVFRAGGGYVNNK